MKKTFNEVLSEIQAATTQVAIEEILSKCTKTQMYEVYEAVLGEEFPKNLKALRKADIVDYCVRAIITFRECAKYKELNSKAKAHYLKRVLSSKTAINLHEFLVISSLYELILISQELKDTYQVYTDLLKATGYVSSNLLRVRLMQSIAHVALKEVN